MTFRSQNMHHYRLVIPQENCYNLMLQLLQMESIQVVDQSDPLSRPFFAQIKRCDQILQKITVLGECVNATDKRFEQYDENETFFTKRFNLHWKDEATRLSIDPVKIIDHIQAQVMDEWIRYQDIKVRSEKVQNYKKQLLEQIACYESISSLFNNSAQKQLNQEYYMNNAAAMNRDITGVSYMLGVCPLQNILKFQKMIYRVSRGYACVKVVTEFSFQGLQNYENCVAIVIYPNSDTSILQKKLKRVVDSFASTTFLFSLFDSSSISKLQQLKKEYDENQKLYLLNENEFTNYLDKIRGIDYIDNWRTYIWREKVIYQNLNKSQSRKQFIILECYVPQGQNVEIIQKINKSQTDPAIQQLPLGDAPTSFTTNAYTNIPQQIVNTYGVPRYQQINPAIFTTVTFPFLFGVMFGDIGHGLVVFVFGCWLILTHEKHKFKKGFIAIFDQLRYMICMMGFFAVYCGFVYNDLFGFNNNIMGSCYDPPPPVDHDDADHQVRLFPRKGCIYSFGIDPVWGRAQNELAFVNPLKMKLSVIIGVTHMILGIFMKALNSLHKKSKIDFICEFVPQLIFMTLLFGYMDFLIIFKWLKPWDDGINPEQWAPSIITTMINLGLTMGKTSTEPDGGSNMWGKRGDTSQDTIQLMFLIIAVLCIPWMLIPKPYLEIKHQKQLLAKKQKIELEPEEKSLEEALLNPDEESQGPGPVEHVETSEIIVHQLIETIQFALAAVSNTASYLRLWALSLAHSQLSKVFFDYSLKIAYTSSKSAAIGAPLLVFGFYFLSCVTFGIILCMDSMECFLHALRLHWVEFQSKFFKGDGYKYEPISFLAEVKKNKATSEF